ncbi:MAG: phosphoribosylanthranilate isomerase [Pirellulales bacterium]
MIFKIKICGLTTVDDAIAAVDAGADAIGLNFYRGSKRCVSVDVARQIVDAVSQRTTCVGVFVNASADEIHAICQQARLQVVQLHGSEPPELIKFLGSGYDIIRARRLDVRGTPAIRADLDACCEVAGFAPVAILIDAAMPGQFGGSGLTVDWRQLENYQAWINNVPLILAGGLNSANVAEAIRIVSPQAVDTASGVESAPGKKDAAKMRDFVAAARAAFAAR